MTIQELVEQTTILIERFKKNEKRPWTIEACIIELMAETGTLANTIMLKEGFRQKNCEYEIDVEDDIADIIFVLVAIANYYKIDIDKAYKKILKNTFEKLNKV